jgi:Lrp/AsnC family transcriptional regulator for asnA, asnC and gidA
MTGKLEDLDRKILHWLWRDARTSNRKIARALSVSEGTVRMRIKRMKDQKLIRISSVTNIAALRPSMFVFIGIEADRSRLRDIAKELCALPEICFVGIMLGRCDILAMAVVGTPVQLADLLTETIASIPGVRTTESWQGLEVVKHDYRWGRVPGTPQGVRPRRKSDASVKKVAGARTARFGRSIVVVA